MTTRPNKIALQRTARLRLSWQFNAPGSPPLSCFVSRTLAMKIRRFNILLALGAFCLMVLAAYLLWDRDPSARWEHLVISVDRLYARNPPAYRLTDHLVGILHNRNPLSYYEQGVDKEQKALLASGHLVETKIRIPAGRSEGDVTIALREVWQRKGLYFSALVDRTNHQFLLISRPQDVAAFSAAIK